jgi:hypothetical protein
MNPRQKLRKELNESGAVLKPDAFHKLYAPTEVKPEPVVQVLEFGGNWHPLAIQKMVNFFDGNRQLRQVFKANGNTCLEVAFHDAAQAQAFTMALQQGQFGGPRKN